DGRIGESNYENNASYYGQSITIRNQATDGADLTPVRLQISPATTSRLTAATAQFEILNQGSTTGDTFQYEIWLGAKDNATDMTGAVKIHESSIEGAMSGVEQSVKNVMLSVTPAISEPGLYYFWLVLDTTDVVIERDETNNAVRSLAPVQVTNEASIDADIAIEGVSFTPSTSTPGGTFSATVDLYNQGSQPTGSFICTIYLSSDMSLDVDSDPAVGSVNVDDLPALGSRQMTAIMETDTGIKTGKYWVYAFCDSSGIVPEANEDNNIQKSESQLTVASESNIDLVMGIPKLESSDKLKDGSNVRVSVILCNKGTTSAGPSYFSAMRTNLCDNSQIELEHLLVEGLEAGECKTINVDKPLVCDFWCPNYKLTFTADATLIVDEINEENNTAALSKSITMTGDDCVCASDAYEINGSIAMASKISNIDDDLTLCKGTNDFFQLDITNGENYEIMLSHDSSRAALKMDLYRGSELVSTYMGGDTLYLSGNQVTNIDESPLYFKVSSARDLNSDANRYHLKTSVYGVGQGIDIAASNLIIPNGMLDASDNQTVSVDIANLGNKKSSDFFIGYYISETSEIDETAWRIARQSVSALGPKESVTKTISLKLPSDTPGGYYHLIAKADDDETNTDIRPTNNLARTSAWHFERSCWDTLDPNESFETARKIELVDGAYHKDELAVCQTNADYYAFDVKNNSTLDITVSSTTKGDFDIVLFDAFGDEMISSRTGATTESIHRDLIVGDQTLYLYVFMPENIYNASELAYSLDIKTGTAPAWSHCDATFEPNNFPSASSDLRQAAISGQQAAICPATDNDYYAITLAANERLQVGFETEETGLRAALYRGSDMTFLGMLTNLKTQTFDYTAITEGTYYLRVFTNAKDAKTMTYRLKWLGEEAGSCDLAVSSLTSSPQNLFAGGALTVDFDVKNIGKNAADYEAEIALSTASRNAILGKLNGNLEPSATNHVREKYTIPAQFQGNATLSVSLTASGDVALGNNKATQNIQIASACQNDAAEPNDNILKATPLEKSFSGIICPSDEDWFSLTLAKDAKISLAFTHTQGDLDLYVYDTDGSEVAASVTAMDTETLELTPGSYYLLVRGADSSVTNAYTISVE
ncbi:MAG: pre-peptidase C-terminal domain-containing protein, partial [Proteobacteria bacterium]|nr:pre-peptidase C-terminal domain-containing protein [Pseudomonadota bacterium]